MDDVFEKCQYCDMEIFISEECNCFMNPYANRDEIDDGCPDYDDYSEESEP